MTTTTPSNRPEKWADQAGSALPRFLLARKYRFGGFAIAKALLSACESEKSLSRLITDIAHDHGCNGISASYCRAKTTKNLRKLGAAAALTWPGMQSKVE